MVIVNSFDNKIKLICSIESLDNNLFTSKRPEAKVSKGEKNSPLQSEPHKLSMALLAKIVIFLQEFSEYVHVLLNNQKKQI